MPLPSNMAQKREELKTQEGGGNPPSNNDDGGNPPSNTAVPPAKDGDRVTISRDEFNELQAARDARRTAEGKAAAMKDDLDALKTRLTELEAGAKGGGEGSAPAPAAAPPSAFQADLTEVALTEDETKEFEEDTIALINKIANNVFSRRAKALVDELNKVRGKLGEIETTATTAVKSSERVIRDAFTQKVADKVGAFSNFEKIVAHKHWQDFLEATDGVSGDTYATLITRNVHHQRLEPMVAIFKAFYDKYMKDEGTDDGGYAGALPSGTSEVATNESGGKETLKLSDRQELHKRYINKEIGYEEFQREKKKFEIADAEGRLDYEN